MHSSKHSVAVVVPLKSSLSELEKFALQRCIQVFGKYPVVFVGPATLDFTNYLNAAPSAKAVTFGTEFFGSTQRHSALLLSKQFYQAFDDYEYILIHHLDAFAFTNKLEYWCAKGYDFIGAPWFKDFGHDKAGGLVAVGNGGFCLRKVQAHLDVLHAQHRYDPIERWRATYAHQSLITRIAHSYKVVAGCCGIGNDVGYCIRQHLKRGTGEDIFWSYDAPKYLSSFNIAPVNEGVQFAFETGLEYLYEPYYKDFVPFGCHAMWNIELLYAMLQLQQPPLSEYASCLQKMAHAAGLL